MGRHRALELFIEKEVARARLPKISRDEVCIEPPQGFGVREFADGVLKVTLLFGEPELHSGSHPEASTSRTRECP